MPEMTKERLLRDLIVDVGKRQASYRGRPIDLSPNTLYPFRMLESLRSVFPHRIHSNTLFNLVWETKKVNVSNLYKVRDEVIEALKPHGLGIHTKPRVGLRLVILDESFDLEKRSESNEALDYQGKLVAYSTWEPSKKAICEAKRSITIVDSFYGEYWDFDLWVEQAVQSRRDEAKLDPAVKKLSISVYMASPYPTNFGAQRKREIKRLAKDNAKCIELLKMPISPEESESYESDFDNYVSGLRLIVDEDQNEALVELNIYQYFTMPSTRMIVIDDKHFFFGWFPLWAHNPKYFCMYLEDASLDGADREVLTKLRGQINNFSSTSELVFSSARFKGDAESN